MEHLGLNRAGRQELEDTLRSSHDIRVTTTLMDLDHDVIGQAQTIGGQVQADRHAFGEKHGPQRRATATLLDPHNTLGVGDSDPDDAQLYYDRIVQIEYGVLCPTLGWVDLPVFTGLPWKLQRTEDEVYLEADDISVLGWEQAWRPLTVEKGIKKTAAARRLLSRSGFDHVRLPERKAKLHKAVSLGRRQMPWKAASQVLGTMDLHFAADGAGIPTARRLPGNALWTFDTEIVDPVAISTDREGFANVVEVIGRRPKGSKRRPRYVAHAPAWHPLSAKNLAHSGQPHFAVETIQSDHFRTVAECRRKAERVLADRLRATDQMTASILPWPHLTQGDPARFTTPSGEVVRDRVDTFDLPLSPSEPMHVGWLDRDHAVKRREVRK